MEELTNVRNLLDPINGVATMAADPSASCEGLLTPISFRKSDLTLRYNVSEIWQVGA